MNWIYRARFWAEYFAKSYFGYKTIESEQHPASHYTNDTARASQKRNTLRTISQKNHHKINSKSFHWTQRRRSKKTNEIFKKQENKLWMKGLNKEEEKNTREVGVEKTDLFNKLFEKCVGKKVKLLMNGWINSN